MGSGVSNRSSENELSKEDSIVSKIGFIFGIFLTSIFLLAAMALVLFWVIMYAGGFDWDDAHRHPKLTYFPLKFNFHPALMIGGFIFFSGLSMLFYRIMSCCGKLIVKLMHTIFHALGIACIAVGFLTIWDSKEFAMPGKIPHFYSLHSWLGLTTMGLFALQFSVGFFSFLILLCCEGGTAACRAALVPTHSTFGLITFVMACATALVGLTETAFSTLNTSINNYKGYERWLSDNMSKAEAFYINSLGAAIGASVITMIISLSYRTRSSGPNRTPTRVVRRTDF